MSIRRFALAALAGALFATQVHAVELLNVSYDPTRELYQQYNAAFAKHWKAETGEDVTIKNSHGGSGKQARSVIDGLQADVVTLALSGDIDALNLRQQLVDPNWQKRLADNSTPYTSTIVFLVRKGNPKGIKDWDDLVKKDVQVITPNPKTSGGARWNFLAAWAYAKAKYGSDAEALKFVTELYRHAPVLDTGARGATISFVQRQLGDVLIAWENEAYLSLKEEGGDQLEIVTPSLSILAEPPVAVVDKVVDKKGTRKQAEAYLQYLYSPEGQRIAAQNFYRPRDAKVAAEFKDQFKPVKLVTIDQEFGGWKEAQPKYFADGGVFDKIFADINK
ncbi:MULTISPECIES: sulfate ABC transporter substrate-binding protein [Pseudomonadaceae]|jgi:sulfate transport system substrate-binding protein|uniref:ABC transporter permease n=1 Tax=Pseudomonas oryzihabitans TaxID=47885 RepID=A0A1G5NDA7_9PSED|nr:MULTISPECIES: sulfate ABC transporter substrate-binding protein [Pseudomonas]MBA1259308.1 sulfate ABC transporter substrate-binding protein [Pseudomonas psychrotolerans]MDU4057572.1 sulfate ABC transporter substrate-binding protein [Pseudomonas oryzihabitans]NMY90446.1 sulfate ABC transporter substrate-binding protein [Pseudomonas psychrotolerans]ONN72143.1 ABC transporter permease [Pseudomonas psychrotolerans]QEU04665.1 sulfate ABC transporter substrate-binding protein [Pseudomonas oryziha